MNEDLTCCSECLYYDAKSEDDINGEKMAMCEKNRFLVSRTAISCDEFAM